MEKRAPFNVILLGDPASGKGTQAARLAKKYGMYNFDMGVEVRKPAVRKKYDYAKTTGQGNLTPTRVVREILKHTIRATPKSRGILFNGHPKMIGEARLVAKWLREAGRSDPFVMYLYVTKKDVLKRTGKRERDDDNLKALRNRERYYREQIARVVKFFKARYDFARVSGRGSKALVWKRIQREVARRV